MTTSQFDITTAIQFDPLVRDFLLEDPKLNAFVRDFPSLDAFNKIRNERTLNSEARSVLSEAIIRQYSNENIAQKTKANITALKDQNVFTVTTGHQLCLFTGPLYFIYKIASTISLSKRLREEFPDSMFVPVYWMASEDHDFDEINHAFFNSKKITWDRNASGAVGNLDTSGIASLIDEIMADLPKDKNHDALKSLLLESYNKSNLAEATRHLVNALFGEEGLVIVDGNDHALKSLFVREMEMELIDSQSFSSVTDSSKVLSNLGYTLQVKPREINLFYLTKTTRGRIVREQEDLWKDIVSEKVWDKAEIIAELQNHPENFSPNVIMRPVYQETILPNLAYVGGPGEIAYWLQLKSTFNNYNISFPLLLVRDSAIVLGNRAQQRMAKLNLDLQDVFLSRKEMINKVIPVDEVSIEQEKQKLAEIFDSVGARAGAIDPTLAIAVQAESKRQLSSLDHIQQKMQKAIRQREEVNIRQIDQLLSEVYPDGVFQERRENYFGMLAFGAELNVKLMIDEFNPLNKKVTIFCQ